MTDFRLYPFECRWWSFNDYGAVLDTMRAIGNPQRILEFGPGSSTLALIEGGATHVDTCEDDMNWARVYRERLQSVYPQLVNICDYVWSPYLVVPGIAGKRYDMALIDGPRETALRPVVVEYCIARCTHVLVPLECNEGSRFMREAVHRLAGDRSITITDTGPLAGAFALIGPPC